MRNFVQTKDQLYLRKKKSEAYKEILDEQIDFKQPQHYQQNEIDHYNRKTYNTKQYRPTKQNSQMKRNGGRLQTLQSRFIPISSNIASKSPPNYIYQDSQSQTQNYLLECEKLINNLKKFNQRQQYKIHKKKHNFQRFSPQKGKQGINNSPLKKYQTPRQIFTNQENGFFNQQDMFKRFYKSKSYDIRPVYKGLKDKPNKNFYDIKQTGKILKNRMPYPSYQINNNKDSYKFKYIKAPINEYSDIENSMHLKRNLQKQRNQNYNQIQRQKSQNKYFNQKNENNYEDANQKRNLIISADQNKINTTNPQQNNDDKLKKLNKQSNVFQKRQGVLRHLKIAKKKGSILFKKIQDFKKNSQNQILKAPYIKFNKELKSTKFLKNWKPMNFLKNLKSMNFLKNLSPTRFLKKYKSTKLFKIQKPTKFLKIQKPTSFLKMQKSTKLLKKYKSTKLLKIQKSTKFLKMQKSTKFLKNLKPTSFLKKIKTNELSKNTYKY